MARRMGWTEEKGWGDSRLLACKSPVARSREIHRRIRDRMMGGGETGRRRV